MDDLKGKTVIVTGAGKGIGRATCKLLADSGAKVVAISRTASDLETLADETGCAFHALDVTDTAVLQDAVSAHPQAVGLVNCAGINVLEPFLETSEDSFDRIMSVNTKSALFASQAFCRSIIARQGQGAIVNVSSLSSFTGFADHTAYCASKGAMDAMSRVIAREMGPHDIRVNCINPIVTMTELAAAAWSDPAKSAPVLARVPLGYFAEPEDIANVILFLLSDRSRMINATAVPVEGGFLSV